MHILAGILEIASIKIVFKQNRLGIDTLSAEKMKLQPSDIVGINKLNIEDSRIPKSINDSLYDTDALNRTSWEENSGFQHISNRKAVLKSIIITK